MCIEILTSKHYCIIHYEIYSYVTYKTHTITHKIQYSRAFRSLLHFKLFKIETTFSIMLRELYTEFMSIYFTKMFLKVVSYTKYNKGESVCSVMHMFFWFSSLEKVKRTSKCCIDKSLYLHSNWKITVQTFFLLSFLSNILQFTTIVQVGRR